MKPAPFAYRAPSTVEEALEILGEEGEAAKVLAGGQSLVPMMNFRLARPEMLVDINRLPGLDRIEEEDGSLRIGALVRHLQVERLEGSGPLQELLRRTARHVGHLPIRVRGTFGGSIAHADPAAEWCVLAAALEAEMVAVSREEGERIVPAEGFFQTLFTTSLRPEELLTEVRLPRLPGEARTGFLEFSRRAGDFAIVAVAALVELDPGSGSIDRARIALGGVSDIPVRAGEAEGVLEGEVPGEELFATAGEEAARHVDPMGDIHGSPEYRRDLVRVLVRRALAQTLPSP